jgi:hypothetical protein
MVQAGILRDEQVSVKELRGVGAGEIALTLGTGMCHPAKQNASFSA